MEGGELMSKHETLRREMDKRELSSNKLALKAMISPANFSQAINGKSPMFPAWRKRIAEVLELPEDALFPEYAKEKGE